MDDAFRPRAEPLHFIVRTIAAALGVTLFVFFLLWILQLITASPLISSAFGRGVLEAAVVWAAIGLLGAILASASPKTNALGLFLLGIALVLLPLRLATGALIDIFKLLWPQRGQSGTG